MMSTEDMELPVTALDFLAIQYQNNPDAIPPILEVADTIYDRISVEVSTTSYGFPLRWQYH